MIIDTNIGADRRRLTPRRRCEGRAPMTHGRKPAGEPSDDHTLFEPPKEHPGGIAERTPPGGLPTEGLGSDTNTDIAPSQTPRPASPITTESSGESQALDH